MTSARPLFVWDADGVLFHSYDARGVFLWSQDIERDLGLSYPISQIIFRHGWDEVMCGRKDTRAHIEECLTRQGVTVDIDRFIAYWLDKDARVNAHTAQFLDPANAVIATNQDILRTRRIGQLFGDKVQKVFASHMIGALKPEAAYYRYIEKDLGKAPEQLCLIDDNAANIDGAKACGWQAHHFTGDAALAAFMASF